MNDIDFLKISREINNTRYPVKTDALRFQLIFLKYLDSSADNVFWNKFEPYIHKHSFFELHLITTGEQNYQIGKNSYPLKENTLLLIPPKALHAIPHCSKIIRKFSAAFDVIALQTEENGALSRIYNEPIFIENATEFMQIFKLIFSLYRRGDETFPTLVHDLFAVLLRRITMAIQTTPSKRKMPKEGKNAGRINEIERFILDNLDMPLNEKLIARHMYLSEKQLNRIIQTDRNITAKHLLDEMRFREAKKELYETADSIAAIAFSTGFSDVTTFIRFFKRMSGETPTKWRKNIIPPV